MKRVILATLFIATLFVLPAISQTSGDAVDSAEAIATLTATLTELQEAVEAQSARIQSLEGRLEAQAAEARKLVKAIEFAEKKGFLLPTPANDARGAFLFGVRRYATVVSGKTPTGSLEDDVKSYKGRPIGPVEPIPPERNRR